MISYIYNFRTLIVRVIAAFRRMNKLQCMLMPHPSQVSYYFHIFRRSYIYVTPVGVCLGQVKNLKFLSPVRAALR